MFSYWGLCLQTPVLGTLTVAAHYALYPDTLPEASVPQTAWPCLLTSTDTECGPSYSTSWVFVEYIILELPFCLSICLDVSWQSDMYACSHPLMWTHKICRSVTLYGKTKCVVKCQQTTDNGPGGSKFSRFAINVHTEKILSCQIWHDSPQRRE